MCPLVDFFILITCLLDNVWIFQGEVTHWSLLGVKGITIVFHYNGNRQSNTKIWLNYLKKSFIPNFKHVFCLQNVVTVADELLENLAVDLVVGDPAREVSDDRLGVMNVRVSDLKTELPISSKPGAPKFDPGEALARTFGTTRMCGGGKTCSGVILKLVQYYKNLLTEDPKNKNNDSEIVASQVCIITTWRILFVVFTSVCTASIRLPSLNRDL